jgi:hypothetical protein
MLKAFTGSVPKLLAKGSLGGLYTYRHPNFEHGGLGFSERLAERIG